MTARAQAATPYVEKAGASLAQVTGKFARDELRQVLQALDDFVSD